MSISGPDRSGSYRKNTSMKPVTGSDFVSIVQQAMNEELILMGKAAKDFHYDYELFDHVRQQPQPLPYRLARGVARAEAAALLIEQPTVPFLMGESMGAYRISRTLELAGAMRRGGNVAMIGSGLTVTEFFALFAEPPSKESMVQLFKRGTDTAIIPKLQYQAHQIFVEDSPPPITSSLLEGRATAVEPDLRFVKQMEDLHRSFNWPKDRLTVLTLTLGEAQKQLSDYGPFNTIWMYRADPQIFDQGESKMTCGGIYQTLKPLIQLLSAGGHFIYTVGTGNNASDLENRVQSVNEVSKVVELLGLRRYPEFPLDIKDREDVNFFAGTYAIKGGVAASKV